MRQNHSWNYFAFNQWYLAKGKIARAVLLPYEQGRRQWGASGARAPHLKSVLPHFTFGPPFATYIQILYFKNVAPPSGFRPLLLVFDPPAAKSCRRACL